MVVAWRCQSLEVHAYACDRAGVWTEGVLEGVPLEWEQTEVLPGPWREVRLIDVRLENHRRRCKYKYNAEESTRISTFASHYHASRGARAIV